LADSIENFELGFGRHAPYGLRASVDGGAVTGAEVEIGYAHRGLEKRLERTAWLDCVDVAQSISCRSPFHCALGMCLALEDLAGIEVPRRAVLLRAIASEAWRVGDHAQCAAECMDATGVQAWSRALMSVRDSMRVAVDCALCVGGLKRDAGAGGLDRLRQSAARARIILERAKRFVDGDLMLRARACGLGTISKESALTWGITGPTLRAGGADMDLRRDRPYLAYDELAWNVPTGSRGDALDRIDVRLLEAIESTHIVERAMACLEPGPVSSSDRRFMLPPKHEVYGGVDGSIRHFKISVDGIRMPARQLYRAVESAGGELGFLLVSTGGPTPHRLRVRSPSLAACQIVPKVLEGIDVEDVPLVLASLGIAGDEMDR